MLWGLGSVCWVKKDGCMYGGWVVIFLVVRFLIIGRIFGVISMNIIVMGICLWWMWWWVFMKLVVKWCCSGVCGCCVVLLNWRLLLLVLYCLFEIFGLVWMLCLWSCVCLWSCLCDFYFYLDLFEVFLWYCMFCIIGIRGVFNGVWWGIIGLCWYWVIIWWLVNLCVYIGLMILLCLMEKWFLNWMLSGCCWLCVINGLFVRVLIIVSIWLSLVWIWMWSYLIWFLWRWWVVLLLLILMLFGCNMCGFWIMRLNWGLCFVVILCFGKLLWIRICMSMLWVLWLLMIILYVIFRFFKCSFIREKVIGCLGWLGCICVCWRLVILYGCMCWCWYWLWMGMCGRVIWWGILCMVWLKCLWNFWVFRIWMLVICL